VVQKTQPFSMSLKSGLLKSENRELLWPSLLLVVAFFLALASSAANRNGWTAIAVAAAIAALVSAAVVASTLIPRLLKRIRLEYWFARITKRGVFFLLLVGMIAIATFNTGNNLLIIALSFLLSALLVSGMFSNLVLYGLRVHLQVPDRIHAGRKTVLKIGLQNLKRRLPSFSITLRGCGPQKESPASGDFSRIENHFPYIQPGGTVSLSMACTFERRGVYPVGGFEAGTLFPFGFFSRRRRIESRGQITIYPALIDLNDLILRHPVIQGSETRHRKGKGTGLYNIRDYQRGDDARFVNWKSTAKLSRLMVKEFLLEEEEEFLHLVFSTFLPATDERTLDRFEKALSTITTLACRFRDQGRSFSFYSGEYETELNGSAQNFKGLLDYLAWVQPARELLLDLRKIREGSILFTAGEHPGLERFPQINYLEI